MRLGTYYSCSFYMPASSCGFDNSTVLDFTFRASGLRLFNSCGTVLYYNLAGESVSTNNDFIAGCSALVIEEGLQTCGLGLRTTSTSTASATSSPLIGVSSWGP